MFFYIYWNPTWVCEFEERVGLLGDGGKWTCDPIRLKNQEKCIILSVGSNDDFSFEVAIHKLAPTCSILTIDHTVVSPLNKPHCVSYLPLGLVSQEGIRLQPEKFPAFKQVLGNRTHIDVLKIDCEGCEFAVLDQLLDKSIFIRQILIEVHFYSDKPNPHLRVHWLLDQILKAGYVMFHKELNTLGCWGNCAEFGFLKLNLGYERSVSASRNFLSASRQGRNAPCAPRPVLTFSCPLIELALSFTAVLFGAYYCL